MSEKSGHNWFGSSISCVDTITYCYFPFLQAGGNESSSQSAVKVSEVGHQLERGLKSIGSVMNMNQYRSNGPTAADDVRALICLHVISSFLPFSGENCRCAENIINRYLRQVREKVTSWPKLMTKARLACRPMKHGPPQQFAYVVERKNR